MRMRALLACIVGLTACSNDVVSPPNDPSPPAGGAAATGIALSGDAAQGLARALAAAMAVPEVRGKVLRAMRASRVTEHKLVWQEFIRTAEGRALIAAAASAAKVDAAELERASSRLPELDFYVPAREHRLTWKGGSDLLVAATVNDNAPTLAYSPGGFSVPLDLRQAPPRHALMVLQPAERKSVRVRVQAKKDGPTIQDSDDGDESGTLVLTSPGGASVVLSLGDIIAFQECIPDDNGGGCGSGGGGGGGGSPPVQDATRLTSFFTGQVCDNNDCGQGNEFEFRSRYYLANGSLAASAVLRREGVKPGTLTTVNAILINRRIRENTTETIRVTLIETDGPFDSDDNYGVSTIRDNPTGPSSPTSLRWLDYGGPFPGSLAVSATAMWTLKY